MSKPITRSILGIAASGMPDDAPFGEAARANPGGVKGEKDLPAAEGVIRARVASSNPVTVGPAEACVLRYD